MVLGLVGIDQCGQNVEPIILRGTAFRTPKTLDLSEGPFIVRIRSKRLQLVRN